MRYYVAAPFGADRRDRYLAKGVGLLYSPTYRFAPRPCEDRQFILDNGAFSAYVNGTPWDEDGFCAFVRRVAGLDITPAFVVLPDIVAGGLRSLDRSAEYISRLPDTWEKYLPVQDGMTDEDIIPLLNRVEGIFVGGTVTWKWRTAQGWCRIAHILGLKCHIGRVNSERQLLSARNAMVDSVDGSTASRNHRDDRLFRHLAALGDQRPLEQVAPDWRPPRSGAGGR